MNTYPIQNFELHFLLCIYKGLYQVKHCVYFFFFFEEYMIIRHHCCYFYKCYLIIFYFLFTFASDYFLTLPWKELRIQVKNLIWFYMHPLISIISIAIKPLASKNKRLLGQSNGFFTAWKTLTWRDGASTERSSPLWFFTQFLNDNFFFYLMNLYLIDK